MLATASVAARTRQNLATSLPPPRRRAAAATQAGANRAVGSMLVYIHTYIQTDRQAGRQTIHFRCRAQEENAVRIREDKKLIEAQKRVCHGISLPQSCPAPTTQVYHSPVPRLPHTRNASKPRESKIIWIARTFAKVGARGRVVRGRGSACVSAGSKIVINDKNYC